MNPPVHRGSPLAGARRHVRRWFRASAAGAPRENLVEALLVRATEALFSMSHGRPDKLCAQGGDAALTALDAVVTAIGRFMRLPVTPRVSSASR
jgi:hypothetical protein